MGISRPDRNRLIAESYVEHNEELRRLGESQRMSWDLAADQVQDFYLHWLEIPVRSKSQPRKKKAKPWAKRGVWLAGLTHHRNQSSRQVAETIYAARRETDQQHVSTGRRTLLDELIEKEAPGLDEMIERILEKHASARITLVYSMRSNGWTIRQIAAELEVSEKTVRLAMKRLKAIVQAETAPIN